MTVEVTDFERDVIEASRERPVLVDFWAPWCGPCRILGPVLEKLAGENHDAWTLAKLNTDENPAVASRYRISSIPAVKLFVDGAVVDEFVGALPEQRVREWLAKAIPDEMAKLVDTAERLIEQGEPEAAASILRTVLAERPGDARASVQLARILVFSDIEQAAALVEAGAPEPELVPVREAVRTLVRAVRQSANPDALPEAPAKTPYVAALTALASGDVDAALQGFIQSLRLDRRYDNGGARLAALAIFQLLGPAHALAKRHRPAFDMALF